jgi:hypothetical protein
MTTMLKYSTLAFSLFAAGAAAEDTTASRNLRTIGTPAVHLGVAGDFAILSASGITDVYPSVVVGNVGTSPIGGTAMLLACDEVVGNIYTVDAAGPACKTTSASMLTTAIGDMETAYNKAAALPNPDYLDLGAGAIGGETLVPGVYKWNSNVLIAADIYIVGTQNDYDKWVFQIDGTLDLSTSIMVHLSNGAMAKNIVWQVAGATTLGATSHFEGIILDKVGINMVTGASMNGRLLSQTAVTLQKNTVVVPQA